MDGRGEEGKKKHDQTNQFRVDESSLYAPPKVFIIHFSRIKRGKSVKRTRGREQAREANEIKKASKNIKFNVENVNFETVHGPARW